jgi:hypothetical protein
MEKSSSTPMAGRDDGDTMVKLKLDDSEMDLPVP